MEHGQSAKGAEDLTGRSRLAKNVTASYMSHLVFVVFGFVLPRTIDESIGQVALGVWDFAWSFVNYLSLAGIGIGSSVNRYVAGYRAAKDNRSLNSTVSTVVAIQLAIALVVLLISVVLAYFVPVLMAHRLGEFAATSRWVIAFLGSALAVEMAFDAWRGVLSGCHRWDYYNALNAGGYSIASILMIIALLSGGGLVAMSIIYFAITVVTEISRYVLAKRVCPEIDVRFSDVNAKDARKVVRFGVKTVLVGLSSIITIQSVSLLVVANLGPAALAILARPLALMRHVGTLITKFANVLTPTAGSLQSGGQLDELREFGLQNARTGWLMTIPPLLLLATVGDLIVEIWMGPGYADWEIMAILALGQMLPVSQRPMLQVLIGMNEHGAVAKRSLLITFVTLSLGILVTWRVGWSLHAAAFLIVLPIALGLGTSVAVRACRLLGINFGEYWRSVLVDVVRLAIPLALILAAIRFFIDAPPFIVVLVASLATGLLTLGLFGTELLGFAKSLKRR